MKPNLKACALKSMAWFTMTRNLKLMDGKGKPKVALMFSSTLKALAALVFSAKSISELNQYGLQVIKAKKGQDSIKFGIATVQQQRCSITKRSINLIKEYRGYMWQTDINGKFLKIPEPGNDHCFVANTKIITNCGNKNIEDIKIADMVLTTHGYKKVLLKHDNGLKQVNKYSLQLDTNKNMVLICTPNHKIKTNLGWIKISKLKLGMMVYLTKNLMEKNIKHDTQDYQNFAIITARLRHLEVEEKNKKQVFDLTVEDAHEYFANGLLVHNCMDAIRYGIKNIIPDEVIPKHQFSGQTILDELMEEQY